MVIRFTVNDTNDLKLHLPAVAVASLQLSQSKPIASKPV